MPAAVGFTRMLQSWRVPGARLEGRGIWRILRKPESVAQLQACVLEEFAGQDAAPPSADVSAQPADPSSAKSDAVLAYFGGDAALFRAAIRTALGSGAVARTRMGCCASSCPRERT